MKLTKNLGCFEDTILVDNINIMDLSEEQIIEVVKELLPKVSRATLIDFVDSALEFNGDFVFSDICEQCGQPNGDYTLTI